jgi:hypothetical protein
MNAASSKRARVYIYTFVVGEYAEYTIRATSEAEATQEMTRRLKAMGMCEYIPVLRSTEETGNWRSVA